MMRLLFCGRISRVDTANGTTDKKRTVDGRMELHPGFDGISEWLYKHGLEAPETIWGPEGPSYGS